MKLKLLILPLLLIFLISVVNAALIDGVTICGDTHLCSGVSDANNVCPEFFTEEGVGSCVIDDEDCCVLYDTPDDPTIEWNIPGDASATSYGVDNTNLCCGINPGEVVRTSDYAAPLVDVDNNVACCDQSVDCSYNSECYAPGTLQDVNGDACIEKCAEDASGTWESISIADCSGMVGCVMQGCGCACGNLVQFTILEQIPGTFGTDDMDFQESMDAEVIAFKNSDLTDTVNAQRTDTLGATTLGLLEDTYFIQVSKERYIAEVLDSVFIEDGSNYDFEIKLRLSGDCQNDFTRNDNVCHSQCYDELAPEVEFYYGEGGIDESANFVWNFWWPDVRDGCEGKRKGWRGYHSVSQEEIFCCGELPGELPTQADLDELLDDAILQPLPEASSTPDTQNLDLPNLETTCRLVLLTTGQPTTMCISTWD